jgi:hypothetical protein
MPTHNEMVYMTKNIILIVELLCVLGATTFAGLWVFNPTSSYEPPLALCSALILVLEVIRRILRSLKLKIFLSVGTTYTEKQELFVSSFERLLADYGCERLVVGRDCPAARQPILQVRDLIKKADAVVVLAFTRYAVKTAIEKPDAKDPTETKEIKNKRYPTVWNQIEAGIAFGLKRPLLVFVEKGLKQEAMLKDRLEFRAIIRPMEPELLKEEEFKGVIADFIRISRRRAWLRL